MEHEGKVHLDGTFMGEIDTCKMPVFDIRSCLTFLVDAADGNLNSM